MEHLGYLQFFGEDFQLLAEALVGEVEAFLVLESRLTLKSEKIIYLNNKPETQRKQRSLHKSNEHSILAFVKSNTLKLHP